jgi:ring-1,2-phenylacetyl-CoA epoxidase subunit PaaC
MTTPGSDQWRHHLQAWADDEFVLGHQLGDLVGSYFDLEEAVALGSLAQDHLVHARELYGLLGIDGDDLDRFVFERDPDEFRNSQLVEARVDDDFAALVVKMALYASAEELRALAAVADGTAGDVAARILEEEAYHREHWWDWLAVLAGSDEGHQRVEQALQRLVPLGADFFDDGLFDNGQGPADGTAQAEEWRTGLSRRLDELGLGPLPGAPGPSSASGRRGAHSPDLAHSLATLAAVREPGRSEVTWG